MRMGDGQRKFLGDEGHWPLQKGFSKEFYRGLYQGHDKVGVSLFDQVKRGPLKPGSKRLQLLRKLLNVYGFFFGGGCSRWGGSERGQRRRVHSIGISDCSR